MAGGSLLLAARRLGPRAGHFVVLAIGVAVAAFVGLVIGLAARASQPVVDARIYDWLAGWFSSEGWWPSVAALYTQLGDPIPMIVQTTAATIAFAVIFRQRWWIPVLLLPVGLGTELTLQKVLEHVIARGHPFAGSGTFPSGGSARFVVIYGLVAFLALVRWPRLRPYWPAAALLVAFLALVEGYTRLYLLMHWPSDVIGGWVVGGLLLAALLASASVVLDLRAMPGAGGHGRPRGGTRPARSSRS